MQEIRNTEEEIDNFNTAGPGSMVASLVAAVIMIAATALFLPSLRPEAEFGICHSFPILPLPREIEIGINMLLIALVLVLAVTYNKKHSFVRSTEALLPATLAVILASNPVNTSYAGTPLVMLTVNLICLDIMMRAYNSQNATTSLFAVATWLSLGSMLQYAFLALIIIYPIMGFMIKVMRVKECVAYLMGLIAPYWVALGFGLISFSDFRLPQFLVNIPTTDGNFLLLIFISLGTLSLVGLVMMLNNAMLIYAGNMRVRTFNNMINLLGFTCAICMLADFDNFGAYAASFCFAVSVQISNFFAMRKIDHSSVWFWSLLSLFMAFFIFMLIEALVA